MEEKKSGCACSQSKGDTSTAAHNDEKLLRDVFKNVKMGVDAINTLLPKVENDALRRDLTTQLLGYQNFTSETTKILLNHGKTPEEPPLYQTLPAEAGIHMNTMMDKSPSKIAELMINGSVMGIIDTTRALHACGSQCPEDVRKLADDVIQFEDNSLMRMRVYL